MPVSTSGAVAPLPVDRSREKLQATCSSSCAARRHGADLWRREEITVTEAVLGTKRTVPFLSGTLEVQVPAGTQPGLVLRLAGQGLPQFGDGRRGGLYVRIDIHVPEHLTRQERELYEELRALEASSTSETPKRSRAARSARTP